MDDLIRRQDAIEALIQEFYSNVDDYISEKQAVHAIDSLPSVQSERKKGKWILTEDDNYEYCTCSECGYQNGENWMNGSDIPFCAMCGADMRGDTE